MVELEGVTFGYAAAPVLSDISLQLQSGEFAALVGPSGAGKTSLLRLILGMCRPSRGSVRVGGERPGDRRGPRVGYVPQLETVDWNFPVTVAEVVRMGRIRRSGLLPWPSAEDRLRVGEVLELLGIGELAGQHIRKLSGGQQQRVFLARALIAEPDLLILDEPTSGVDARTAEGVLHLVGELNHRGLMVLMTTHDLNMAAAHVPCVVCLNHRVIAMGPPEEVFTEEILSETYGGEMVVVRQDGMLFVHQKPHPHSYRDLRRARTSPAQAQPDPDGAERSEAWVS